IVLDMSILKLTLPLDTPNPGQPDEVVAPQLATFVAPGIFQASDDATGVLFRAPCSGFTTSSSRYPRCEFREMRSGGKDATAWNTTDVTIHSLITSLAVTHVPA